MLVLNKEELADCKDVFTDAQSQMRFGTLRATINSLHLDLVSVAALTAILGEVSSTNHDPSLIAGYYMACVEKLAAPEWFGLTVAWKIESEQHFIKCFKTIQTISKCTDIDMWHQPRFRG